MRTHRITDPSTDSRLDAEVVTAREVATVTGLLLTLAIIVLGANFFGGETVAPMDLLGEHPGWREAGIGVDPVSPHRTDILDGLLPRWLYLKSAIRSGSLPTWNPLPGGGEPGWQLLFNCALTPRFWVFVVFGDALGFGLGLVLQMVIGGLGAHLLTRRWTGAAGAFFAAVTFMLCGFNVSWMMWPHAATSAWIPWVVWAVAWTIDRGDGRSIAVLAAVTSCLLFGGFPAVAAYGLYLAAAYLLVRSVALGSGGSSWRLAVRPSSLAATGLLLGLLMAAVQILPSLEFLSQVDLAYRGPIGPVIDPRMLLFTPLSGSVAPHPETTGYAGILALVLALVAAAPRVAANTRKNPNGAAFWTAATAVSLMLALRFPSPVADLVYHLPGLSLNPNNRLLVIYGLAIAILAGIGLDRLMAGMRRPEPSGRQKWLVIGAASLIAVQAADLTRVSRVQNAIVPVSTFLPETSVIRWLQDILEPGQGVVAEGFITAGTLSSYGIPEWFAHGFHTNAEKALLEGLVADAWVTPTAAFPSFARTDLAAGEIFDLLSVRFFVTPCAVARDVLTPSPRNRPDHTIPLTHGLEIRQSLAVESEIDIDGIAVLMSGSRPPPFGAIELELHSNRGELVAEVSLPTRTISGTNYFDLLFSDRITLAPGEYELLLQSIVAGGPPPAAWFRSGPMTDLVLNGAAHPGEIAYQLIGLLPMPDPARWRLALSSHGMCVVENLLAPGGAGFTGERSPGAEVETLEFSASSASFRVTNSTGARLVRSARFYPGWTAAIDGAQAPVTAFRGALQSVAVPAGESTVEWRYEPTSLKVGFGISSMALLVLIFLCLSPLKRS